MERNWNVSYSQSFYSRGTALIPYFNRTAVFQHRHVSCLNNYFLCLCWGNTRTDCRLVVKNENKKKKITQVRTQTKSTQGQGPSAMLCPASASGTGSHWDTAVTPNAEDWHHCLFDGSRNHNYLFPTPQSPTGLLVALTAWISFPHSPSCITLSSHFTYIPSSPSLHGSLSPTVPPASLSSYFPIYPHHPHCMNLFSPSVPPASLSSHFTYIPSSLSLHGSLSPTVPPASLSFPSHFPIYPHPPHCMDLFPPQSLLHHSPHSSPIYPHPPQCMDLFPPQSLLHHSPHSSLYTLIPLTAWISFPHSPSCIPLLTFPYIPSSPSLHGSLSLTVPPASLSSHFTYIPSSPSLHGSLSPTVPPASLSSHFPIYPHPPHCMDLFPSQSLLHHSPHILPIYPHPPHCMDLFPSQSLLHHSPHILPIYPHPPHCMDLFPPQSLLHHSPHSSLYTLIPLTAWISFCHILSFIPLLTFPYTPSPPPPPPPHCMDLFLQQSLLHPSPHISLPSFPLLLPSLSRAQSSSPSATSMCVAACRHGTKLRNTSGHWH